MARVIFDIFERKRWITKLHMMQFIGETHIDFVRWRGPAIAASVVVIAIGMAAVFPRGADLFDIDFTGGASVQVLLKPDHRARHRRRARNGLRLCPTWPRDSRSAPGQDEDLEFKIDTSERDMQRGAATAQRGFWRRTGQLCHDLRNANARGPGAGFPATSKLRACVR